VRTYTRALIALVLTGLVTGFGAPRALAAAAPAGGLQNGSIAGKTVDTAGTPLANVQVLLEGPTAASTTSNGAGAFSFDSVAPGSYAVSGVKTGYISTTLTDVSVLAGSKAQVTLTMTAQSLTSLRVLGREVISARRARFNKTQASVAVVPPTTYLDQGQPQVMRVLDQTPGIVIGHPGSTANNASPGAITFANIRGGLSFETATLIDGHPVSNGAFGNYVTTFLNTYALADTELIKGPGAAAPEINYAIGGTVNFRTKDPTQARREALDLGYDSQGGSILNLLGTGTLPGTKWGYALDYAVFNTPGPLNHTNSFITLPGGAMINGQPVNGFTTTAVNNPANINNPFNATSTIVACCFPVSTTYVNKAELAKIRYTFSNSTVATVSYLGSQTWSDQNGNHVSILPTLLTPSASGNYIGKVTGSVPTLQGTFFPDGEWEVNNEPIFQADVRTTLRKDTILARWYSASINRLQYNALNDNSPVTDFMQLYGTVKAPGLLTFNGQTAAVTINGAYFRSTEEDKLHGGSVEYDHLAGQTQLTLAYDQWTAASNTYSLFGNSPAVGVVQASNVFFSSTIPAGSNQRFGTLLLRGSFPMGDRVQGTLSNYINTYNTRFSADRGATFQSITRHHYDARFGMAWQPTSNVSYRFAIGSAVAPPYLFLVSQATTAPFCSSRTPTFCTSTLNNGGLLPETSFGYDVGEDVRYGDGLNLISWDFYSTSLHNQFLSSVFVSGNNGLCTGGPCPIFTTQNQNLGSARYEGLEASVQRQPPVGLGFQLQGALIKAYPYGISPNFYATSVGPFTTNLAIVNGINFQSSGSSGSPGSFNAVSNQSIPYSSGYGALNYRGRTNYFYELGTTYYGPNNSYNRPAFLVWNATMRYPIDRMTSIQMSVDNLTNIYGSSYIDAFSGVPVAFVNGARTPNGANPVAFGLTNGNVVGPRTYRFTLRRTMGY
jgi:outer membrane receptor protein involved in Fe transport